MGKALSCLLSFSNAINSLARWTCPFPGEAILEIDPANLDNGSDAGTIMAVSTGRVAAVSFELLEMAAFSWTGPRHAMAGEQVMAGEAQSVPVEETVANPRRRRRQFSMVRCNRLSNAAATR